MNHKNGGTAPGYSSYSHGQLDKAIECHIMDNGILTSNKKTETKERLVHKLDKPSVLHSYNGVLFAFRCSVFCMETLKIVRIAASTGV